MQFSPNWHQGEHCCRVDDLSEILNPFATTLKTTADVFESVVGAFVLCNGFGKIFKALGKLGVDFKVPINFKRLREIPPPVLGPPAGYLDAKYTQLQETIAHDFVNKPLVELVLVSDVPM